MLPSKQSQALQGRLRLHQEPGDSEESIQTLHSSCVTCELWASDNKPTLQSFGAGGYMQRMERSAGCEGGAPEKPELCVTAPSWDRAGCRLRNPGRQSVLLPSFPSPHTPGPRVVSSLPCSNQVFPGLPTRVGCVLRSKSETRAILKSTLATGTEPEGQIALWDRG